MRWLLIPEDVSIICFVIILKFQYYSLTVPINNRCSECPPNHVDLSTEAFNYLEPQGGTVGIAKSSFEKYLA
jgi:hypothetical protein